MEINKFLYQFSLVAFHHCTQQQRHLLLWGFSFSASERNSAPLCCISWQTSMWSSVIMQPYSWGELI